MNQIVFVFLLLCFAFWYKSIIILLPLSNCNIYNKCDIHIKMLSVLSIIGLGQF